MDTRPLSEMVDDLSPDLQSEVRQFVEFLRWRRRQPRRRLKQDWAGALRDLRDQYTSLDLQRLSVEWRGD
jgi:hypothetical protein